MLKIANYTTEVPADKSVLEIQSMIASVKAEAMMVEYDNGEACAISFRISRNGRQLGFRLPCDWKRTLKVIHAQRLHGRFKSPQQAKRVAWRILRDWLRAQIAMVEIDSVDIEQVFLSYAVTPNGDTLYERLKNESFQQLCLPEKV